MIILKYDFKFIQEKEGSILFKKPFYIAIEHDYDEKFSYEFSIYMNNKLKLHSERSFLNQFNFLVTEYANYTANINIYKDNKIISSINSPVLDLIEDFVSINKVELIKENNNLIARIESNLNLSKEYYAYYLIKEGVAIEKVFYTKNKEHTFKNLPSGEYYVRVFTRLIKNCGYEDKVILSTNTIIL